MKFVVVLVLLLGLGAAGASYYFLVLHKDNQLYSPSGMPITSAPASLTLNVDDPSDDLLVFDSSIVISGKTMANLDVLVSSENKDSVVKSKVDGSFSSDFELKTGVNTITVTVFDSNGEERQIKRTVYYSKEKI